MEFHVGWAIIWVILTPLGFYVTAGLILWAGSLIPFVTRSTGVAVLWGLLSVVAGAAWIVFAMTKVVVNIVNAIQLG